MKQLKLIGSLPWIVSALGAVCLVLRWILYRVGLDDRLLLRSWHPLSILVWLLTISVFLLIFLGTRKREAAAFEAAFPPSRAGCIGCCVAAFLICYTALSMEPKISGAPGFLWKVLGILCAPSLLAAGYGRLFGRKLPQLLFTVPCLFFLFHIVTHYRTWSSEAQLQTYFFPLFAAVALTFFLFYVAAYAVDLPYRQNHIPAGLLSVFLCLVDLSRTQYPWLCIAGILLCLTTLHPLKPNSEHVKEEVNHDPA